MQIDHPVATNSHRHSTTKRTGKQLKFIGLLSLLAFVALLATLYFQSLEQPDAADSSGIPRAAAPRPPAEAADGDVILASPTDPSPRSSDASMKQEEVSSAPVSDRVVHPSTDLIGEPMADGYALLHAGATREELRRALVEIYKRVPGRYVSDAHREAIARGEYELLQPAPAPGSTHSNYAPSSGEMARNIPFVSVYSHQADGSVVRSSIDPSDLAAYHEDVCHAIWIHFESRRRRALR